MIAFLTYGDEIEGPFNDRLELQARMQELGKAGVPRIEITRADVVCDFCSLPLVRWLFEIPVLETPVVSYGGGDHIEHHHDSDGRWGACDECKNFIMAGDWKAMQVRSVEHARTLHTMMEHMPQFLVELSVANAHGFFKNGWESVGLPNPEPVKPDTDFLNELGIDPLD